MLLLRFTALYIATAFLFSGCQNAPSTPTKDVEVTSSDTSKLPAPKYVSSQEASAKASRIVKEVDDPVVEQMSTDVEQEVPPTKQANAVQQKVTTPTKQPKAQLKSASEEPQSPPPATIQTTSSNQSAPQPAEKTASAQPDHTIWNDLLQQYVSNSGQVNYKAWKGNRGQLDTYLKDLAAHPPQSDWSRNEKMAYWINAYNAFTIDLILKNYPLPAITKLDGGKTWDVRRIELGNKMYSLNNIENDILRPKFQDARIHFAVNCAAKSCPPLLNRAFMPNTLNSQLEAQTKKFINNNQYNSIATDAVTVSKIFDWYGSDFGNLVEYLNKYSNTTISSDAAIKFAEYNWALNE